MVLLKDWRTIILSPGAITRTPGQKHSEDICTGLLFGYYGHDVTGKQKLQNSLLTLFLRLEQEYRDKQCTVDLQRGFFTPRDQWYVCLWVYYSGEPFYCGAEHIIFGTLKMRAFSFKKWLEISFTEWFSRSHHLVRAWISLSSLQR